MAKQAIESKPTVVSRVHTFYQEVLGEMSKVTWPTQDELKNSTSVVLLMLAIMALLIYAYDIIFGAVVVGILNRV